jgi:hypothetical protein
MPADRAEAALLRRVEELDAEWPLARKEDGEILPPAEQHARLAHFVDVMSGWTDSVIEVEAGLLATINPETADALSSGSRLLAEIERFDPGLVSGPMDKAKQRWTPIGRSASSGKPPSRQRFVAPHIDQPAAIKPPDVGFYTSTAIASAGGASMWRTHLGPGGSMMYPLPRYTWELAIDKDARIAEIRGATDWVDFVCAHSRFSDGLIFPDWAGIAQSYDAVHLTLRAIAAAQGFSFDTPHGVIPPAFWDAETTFWLSWCVTWAQLVETIGVRGKATEDGL